MNKIAIIALLICTAAFAQQKGTFTDPRDGKKYKSVTIGKQTWMAENLNYAGKNECEDSSNCSMCYDDNPANCKKYGRLYGWETAMEACPNGWHLPSKNEWQTLVNFVGGEKIAREKLKANSGWDSYQGKSGSGTDNYEFSALPGGSGSSLGPDFDGVGERGYWWTTTAEIAYAYTSNKSLSYYDMSSSSNVKFYLCSVRCLQD